MKKGSKITPADYMKQDSLDYWKLIKDEVYTVIKTFWRNGEGHVTTDKGTWPDVFFKELK
jgi:hypothetical protein